MSPRWQIPSDIADLVEAEGGIWENDCWSPILLTVMSGTVYRGRDIPLAWQIEFEASGNLDGYSWAELIGKEMRQRHPEATDELHFHDTEAACCVIWVESEATCRKLVETSWQVLNAPQTQG